MYLDKVREIIYHYILRIIVLGHTERRYKILIDHFKFQHNATKKYQQHQQLYQQKFNRTSTTVWLISYIFNLSFFN